MPTWIVITWRTVFWVASSTLPYSTPLSETPRLTSFSSTTTRSAARRSSLTVRSVSTSSFCSIEELVFLKSNRVLISRWAWSTALRTSWWSTSETMSKLGMAPRLGATADPRVRAEWRRGRYDRAACSDGQPAREWVGTQVAKGS